MNPTADTLSLTFDTDHTHAGKLIKRGDKRDIEAHHADWLIAQRVAHLTPSPTIRAGKARREEPTGEHDHV